MNGELRWDGLRVSVPEGMEPAVLDRGFVRLACPDRPRGRDADPALGAAFIQAARRMLAPKGSLWLVANRHLPYDAVLSDAFLEYNEIAGTPAFRVIHATKPRFQAAKPKR